MGGWCLQTGLWEKALSDPILTYVFPTRLRHGISHASGEALPWRVLGHLGLSTHHNPSPSPMTPSKHKDLSPPTYASGSPERGPGGCVCSPPFPSGPVSPTKSLKGLRASSHQSLPPTLRSIPPYHIYWKSRIYNVSPCQRTSRADT